MNAAISNNNKYNENNVYQSDSDSGECIDNDGNVVVVDDMDFANDSMLDQSIMDQSYVQVGQSVMQQLLSNQLTKDSIFMRLCAQSDYKSNPDCRVCNKKFTFFKKNINCRFCGFQVCSSHAKRKRVDPQNSKNFQHICDLCQYKYLMRMATKDSGLQSESNEKQIYSLENEQISKEKFMEAKKNVCKNLKAQTEEKTNVYLEQIKKIGKDTSFYQIQIIQLEQKLKELKQCNEIINDELQSVKEQETQLNTTYDSLLKLSYSLTHKMTAADQDIRSLVYHLHSIQIYIEQCLSQQNKQLTPQMSNFLKSSIQDNSKQSVVTSASTNIVGNDNINGNGTTGNINRNESSVSQQSSASNQLNAYADSTLVKRKPRNYHQNEPLKIEPEHGSCKCSIF